MLSLTRKSDSGPKSTIVIDGNIRVTVVGVTGNQVRLAIDAPKEVTVDREEVHMRKNEEK